MARAVNESAGVACGNLRGGRLLGPWQPRKSFAGVMGAQPVRDVTLIRQAYVRPDHQRRGIGAALINQVKSRNSGQMVIAIWAAVSWAIAFYQRHGFELVSADQRAALLNSY